jgi:hypothetical protein
LFRHIYRPLTALFPQCSSAELGVAREPFSAIHQVLLGLEQKLILGGIDALRKEIATVRAMVDGLIAKA